MQNISLTNLMGMGIKCAQFESVIFVIMAKGGNNNRSKRELRATLFVTLALAPDTVNRAGRSSKRLVRAEAGGLDERTGPGLGWVGWPGLAWAGLCYVRGWEETDE